MNRWSIEYYEDDRGRKPVGKFIDTLPVEKRANIFRVLDLVEVFGIQLGPPYMKKIENSIWELRPGRTRILYFIHTGRKFVLLHAFTKKTRKTPRKEIRIAKKRQKEYEQRQ